MLVIATESKGSLNPYLNGDECNEINNILCSEPSSLTSSIRIHASNWK